MHYDVRVGDIFPPHLSAPCAVAALGVAGADEGSNGLARSVSSSQFSARYHGSAGDEDTYAMS